MSDDRPLGGGENRSMAFMDQQDRPLTKSKFEVSEYPQGFNPNEQTKTNVDLPLFDRIKHKLF